MHRAEGGATAEEADDEAMLEAHIRLCNMRFAAVRNSGELRDPARVAIAKTAGLELAQRKALAERVAELIDDEWQVDEMYGKPTVGLIVTGGAQDFKMLPRVERVFREGLVRAAEITNAVVFTGGTSSGVMKYVGEALDPHPDIPSIGIPNFGNIVGHDAITTDERVRSLADAHRLGLQEVDYPFTEAHTTREAAALEPNHTHFLLVDSGHSGDGGWGKELEFVLDVSCAYCAHEQMPAVMLLIQGGPNSLRMVELAVERSIPVVVVADSLGAASAIHDFFTRSAEEARALDAAERALREAEAAAEGTKVALLALGAEASEAARAAAQRAGREARKLVERARHTLHVLEARLLTKTDAEVAAKFSTARTLGRLRALRKYERLIELFSLRQLEADGLGADISLSVLSAVTRSPTLNVFQKLELAIVWNNIEMIAQILAGTAGVDREAAAAKAQSRHFREQREQLRRVALQLALELQRVDAVAMLLSNGAELERVAISRLYMLRDKNPFRLFAKLQAAATETLRRGAGEAEEGEEAEGGAGRGDAGSEGSAGGTDASTAHAAAPPPPPRALRSAHSLRADWRVVRLLERPRAAILRPAQLQRLCLHRHSIVHHRALFGSFIAEWVSEEDHDIPFYAPRASRASTRAFSPRLYGAAAAHAEGDGSAQGSAAGGGGGAAEGSGVARSGESTPDTASNSSFVGLSSSGDVDASLWALTREHGAAPGAAAEPSGSRLRDVFLWAVLMADMELATVVWRSSRQHIRLALIAASILHKMGTRSSLGRKHGAELEPMREQWAGAALGVLDNVRPVARDRRTAFQVAEEVLEHRIYRAHARADEAGAGGSTTLDLAMRLRAKDFAAHRYCQLIMTRRWTGRQPSGVRFVDDTTRSEAVWLKMLLPWPAVASVLARHRLLGRLLPRVTRNAPRPSGSQDRRERERKRQERRRRAERGARRAGRLQPAEGEGALIGAQDAGGAKAAEQSEPEAEAAEAEHADAPPGAKSPRGAHARVGPAGGGGGVGRYSVAEVYSIPVVKFWARAWLSQGGLTLLVVMLVSRTPIVQPGALREWPSTSEQGLLEALFLLWTLGIVADVLGGLGARVAWARRTAHTPAWVVAEWLWLGVGAVLILLRAVHLLAYPAFAGWAGDQFVSEWLFPLLQAFIALCSLLRLVVETVTVNQSVGVLTICVREMLLLNIVRWAAIAFLCVLGFSLAFIVIVPNYPNEAGVLVPGEERLRATGPGWVPVWSLFGDFDVEALEAQRPVIPSALLLLSMVATNVLLLNLLIAMMNDTYQRVMAQASTEWKFEHMLLIDYYGHAISAVPPPLNLVLGPLAWGARLLCRARGAHGVVAPDPSAAARAEAERCLALTDEHRTQHDTEHRDETRAFRSYLAEQEQHAAAQVDARVVRVQRVLAALEKRQMKDREALDSHVGALHGTLETLSAHTTRVPRSQLSARARAAPAHARAALPHELHWRARVSGDHAEGNGEYVGEGARALVPDAKVPWEVLWPDYAPNEWTHPAVRARPAWADHPNPLTIDFSQRTSHEGPIVLDALGRPLNPRGRTGISGRGLLGKWGPNHAVDPIVLRRKPRAPGEAKPEHGAPELQMVTIIRADSGKAAIPGGMVDEGELVSETLRREFSEEAGAVDEPSAQVQLQDDLDAIFNGGGARVYEGYVDDPRNTDNAWMETTVHAFFIDDELASRLQLKGGSDAKAASWRDVSELLREGNDELYANHQDFVRLATDPAFLEEHRLLASSSSS